MNTIIVPALIFIFGAALVPLLKNYARKIYILILPILGFIDLLLIKTGTIVKLTVFNSSYLNITLIPLHADRLSLFMGYTLIIFSFFAFLYSIHIDDKAFQIVGLLYLGSALGVVFAGDFFTLYVFWELVALTGTGMIVLNKDPEARSAALRYLIMHLIGGLILLGGIWLYFLDTGSLIMTRLHAGLPLVLLIIGIGVNTAFILIHTWLPDTYPRAPFYASILLSVFTTKTAAYVLARTAPGWSYIAYIGAIMTVFGAGMALMQNNGRKLLSYHIISQVGYIVAGIGLGTAIGVDGAMLHLLNNVLYKTVLFMGIGSALYVVGKENLDELGGLWRKMPVTSACVVIASLSISGVPLFNGFISKGLLFKASHPYDYIYLLLELGAVGTFLSFLKFAYYGFLRPNPKIEAIAKKPPLNMRISMISMSALCIAIGILPGIMANLLPYHSTIEFFGFDHVFGTMQIFAVCIIAFTLGRSKIFIPHKRITYDLDVFYIKFVESLAFIPKTFHYLNEVWTSFTEQIPSWLSKTKQPLSTSISYLSDFLFAAWVDFWLFTPTSQFEGSEDEKPKDVPVLVEYLLIPFKFITNFIDNLGRIISTLAASFDAKILDKASRQVASDLLFNIEEFNTRGKTSDANLELKDKVSDKTSSQLVPKKSFFNVEEFNANGNRISSLSTLFDKYIVDGIVNAVAYVIWYFGERARRVQTGLVQNYALIIIFIVSVFIIILSIRGGF